MRPSLLLRDELIAALEIVAVAGWQEMFVLEPAHDNAGSHSRLGGNASDRNFTVGPHRTDRFPLRRGDERFGCEAVGLFLLLRIGAVPLHEDFLLSMQEDVSHLVEKRKPKVVVALIA